jgi:hypothetical protein
LSRRFSLFRQPSVIAGDGSAAIVGLRAFARGAIGSAGLAYVMNLWMLSHRTMRFEGQRIIWHVAVPLASYTLITASAAGWALEAPFANALCALGVTILLVTALRNTWMVTLGIARRE